MENLQINESLALGQRIASAIARSGRKKKDIAVELGYSPQAVTGWEKTGRIQLSTLRDLGLLLGENLLGVNGVIADLDQAIQEVIKIMQETDNRGREKILSKVKDELLLHKAFLLHTSAETSAQVLGLSGVSKSISDNSNQHGEPLPPPEVQ